MTLLKCQNVVIFIFSFIDLSDGFSLYKIIFFLAFYLNSIELVIINKGVHETALTN